MGKVQEYEIRLKDKFSKNLKNAGKANKSFNTSLGKTAKLAKSFAPVAGTAALAIAFKKVVETSSRFEKEMSEVKAVSQATEMQFKRLTAQAEMLGRTTVFSAQDAAEGMKFLSMAGFSVENTMKALPGTLDLAAAGTIGLGKAADIASNVLTQFGLAANEMNNVNDIIVATTTKTNTNIEQLAEGLKYTGTTAKILKMPLEETSAALGVLANAGLQGSMGGTSLNFALLEMSRVSSPTAKKLKKLGIATHDVNGNFVGLTKMLEQFEEKGIKSTTILDTFGARGGRAMGTLVEAGSDAVKTFTELNRSSQGIAKRIAKMKLDNLAGDMKLLSSASQGLAITLGKRMNPTMRKTTKATTKLVNAFEKMVRVPVAKTIREESTQAAVLVGKLRNSNLKEAERLEIITKLRDISPQLVDGIDSENLSMTKLTSNLKEYNKLQAKRIVLAGLEEEELKLINKEAQRRGKIEKLLGEARLTKGGLGGFYERREKALEYGNKSYADKMTKFIEAVEKGDVKLTEAALENLPKFGMQKEGKIILNQLRKINEEAGEQIDIGKRIQRLQEQLGITDKTPGLGDKTITGTLVPDKSAKKLTSTITSAAPKVININIEKLIETQEIKTETLQESMPKIKKMVTQTILEALNDTQLTNRAS